MHDARNTTNSKVLFMQVDYSVYRVRYHPVSEGLLPGLPVTPRVALYLHVAEELLVFGIVVWETLLTPDGHGSGVRVAGFAGYVLTLIIVVGVRFLNYASPPPGAVAFHEIRLDLGFWLAWLATFSSFSWIDACFILGKYVVYDHSEDSQLAVAVTFAVIVLRGAAAIYPIVYWWTCLFTQKGSDVIKWAGFVNYALYRPGQSEKAEDCKYASRYGGITDVYGTAIVGCACTSFDDDVRAQ